MKKILKIFIIIFVITFSLLFLASKYIEAKLLDTFKQSFSAESELKDVNLSLFNGISFKGIKINNHLGNNLTADEFNINYQLLPLLNNRIVLSQLNIDKPIVSLNNKTQRNSDNTNNNNSDSKNKLITSQFNISLEKIKINHGEITLNNKNGNQFIKAKDVNLITNNVEYNNGKLIGKGNINIKQLDLANNVFIKNIISPVDYSEQILLNPLKGELAGGNINGNLIINLLNEINYNINLQFNDIDVATLLQEANLKPTIIGKLQINTDLKGSNNLASIKGNGHAEIFNGQFHDIPLLELLATLLKIDELRSLFFNEMKIEFIIENNEMQTPLIKIVSPNLYINGKGVFSLIDKTLNHQFTLAFAPNLIKNSPLQLKDIFVQQSDGFLAINFQVSGLYSSPKTDLTEKITKGAVNQLLNKGLKGFFKY